jgi:DNA polymerase V
MPKKSVKKSVKKTVKKVANKPGAGRPKGSGKFGCPTKIIRIPVHLEQEILEFAIQKNKSSK